MCGLSGVLSNRLNGSEEGLFRDLLNISSLRGFQGSGVMVHSKPAILYPPKRPGVVRVIRSRFVSGALAYSDELDEALKGDNTAIIGHARWPTKGGTEDKSIHPHRHGHIIGVHNGTLYKVAGQDLKDGENDSSQFFKAVSEVGITEAIKDTRGAYAFVWIDEREQTLNFLRNYQRTLFFKNVGYNKHIQTLYWASEQSMLDFIFERSYRGTNTWDTYMPVDTLIKYPLQPGHRIVPVEVVKDFKPTPFVYKPNPTADTDTVSGARAWRGREYTGRFSDPDLIFNPVTGRMEPACSVPLLPPPALSKKEERRAKAIERGLQKARERQNIQEAAAKASGTFREEPRGESVDETTETEIEANTPPPTRYNHNHRGIDDLPWTHNHGGHRLNDTVQDLFPDRQRWARGYYGKSCSWCGDVAKAGDRVVPVGSDLGGSDDFVCLDCSKYDGCKEWLNGKTPVTVTMD